MIPYNLNVLLSETLNSFCITFRFSHLTLATDDWFSTSSQTNIFAFFPNRQLQSERFSRTIFLAAFSLHPLFSQKLRSPKRYCELSPSRFQSPLVLIQAYRRFSTHVKKVAALDRDYVVISQSDRAVLRGDDVLE